MKHLNFRIIGLFIFIIISWGIAWPINKIGLAYMSPLWYTAARLVMGTATMMALVIAVGKFALPQRKDYPLIIVIGLLQISLYILLTNLGLAYLPAGRSSLLAYTTPLWVMPIATLFFKERAGILSWIGFFLGTVGLIILLSPWELNWRDTHILFGAAMLLLASLSWAISMLGARYMHWSKSPLELIPWQLLVGTLPILLFAWLKEPVITVQWNAPLLLSLVYTGMLVTGISYWTGVVINRELPTIIVSLGFLLVPLFSMMVSALFMGESINFLSGCAIGLILLGLICVVIKPATDKDKEEPEPSETESELGKKSHYINTYQADLLFPLPRQKNRTALGIDNQTLPFYGFDCWNHYEVSWLNSKGKPVAAIAEIIYSCDSLNIIESKSMKLYFNSFNQTSFHDVHEVETRVTKDLEERLKGGTLTVRITPLALIKEEKILPRLNGIYIDELDISCNTYHTDASLLSTNNSIVEETLFSDLLKSNCLVTNQPDWCSVQITYKGKQINHENLLRYLVSFRNDNEFHEQCIEKIFIHLMKYCQPSELTVYGRSTRRGGLDINSFRSTIDTMPSTIENTRLCRQ